MAFHISSDLFGARFYVKDNFNTRALEVCVDSSWIVALDQVSLKNVAEVGGKNASLGEMLQTLQAEGIAVPNGFAITASAYRALIAETGIEAEIRHQLSQLRIEDVHSLQQVGSAIRQAFHKVELPAWFVTAVTEAYAELEQQYGVDTAVAVRSSATAEDLPGASFAGQHDSFLGVQGLDRLLTAVKEAMGSLYNDRAISYRHDQGFDQLAVALSVGVQKMVQADSGGAGVIFTVDPESGFRDVVVINSIWGLGELIVQGRITPDEHLVFKTLLDSAPNPIIGKTLGVKQSKLVLESEPQPHTQLRDTTEREQTTFVLSDAEALQLARWAVAIEAHYSKISGVWTPMDIEWAKDGLSGELFIVQARPETVHSGDTTGAAIKIYEVSGQGATLVEGISVGQAAVCGKACKVASPAEMDKFQAGDILVTDMTDPDWEPIMKIAAGIITNRGGRTSHAAIVSRELGVPAIVGTVQGTELIKDGAEITLDATGARGTVSKGQAQITVRERQLTAMPAIDTKIYLNIATPDSAFQKSRLPAAGVGLAREEFIIASRIGVHPCAALQFETLPPELQQRIVAKTVGWSNPVDFYTEMLAYGIGQIAAAFFPRPVIVRFSDFKTNEYRALLGGELFEPAEENPMLGWRGASRYYHPDFKAAFALECRAIALVRDQMGLGNIIPMVPFCRTPEEGRQVLQVMSQNGVPSATYPRIDIDAYTVYMMCEIPSNIILIDDFLSLFDGFSIGSNDLTQLMLGLDRDSAIVSSVADEQNPAVLATIRDAIRACRRRGKYIGICGQAPSDIPGFLEFLVCEHIDTISLNPDSFFAAVERVANIEQQRNRVAEL